ncbi:MAG: zinc transporter ZntB [Proteobacteria bacterium]|nr:zinc transporter ZntB [Pseudomonadota bacterium]
MHLDRSSETAQKWVENESGLDQFASEALFEIETRPRCINFRQGVIVILRGVNLNPGAEPEDMVALRLWVDESRVISVRTVQLLAAQDVRKDLTETLGPRDAAWLLAAIANRLIDRVGPIIDDMSDEVDGLDEDLLVSGNRAIRSQLLHIRREAILLRRYLAPQRDALTRLHQDEHPVIQQNNRMRLRETADRVQRIIEELDELRERTAIIQDELSTRISEQMNKTMYLLTMVASFVMPLSFVTGLLGVNVGGIPGQANGLAFPIVIGILVAMVVVQVFIFRRLKWM